VEIYVFSFSTSKKDHNIPETLEIIVDNFVELRNSLKLKMKIKK